MAKKQKKARGVFRGLFILTSLAVCGAIGAWYFWESQVVEVDTALVELTEFSVVVTGSGKILPNGAVDIYPMAEGLVDEVFVEDGDHVEEGDELLSLLHGPAITAPVAGTVIIAPTPATAQSIAVGGGVPVSGATPMEGYAVAPGMVLFTLYDPGDMKFVAEISEADIARLSLDQSATVTLDAFEGKLFEGSIVKIAQVAQTTMTGGTVFPVEVALKAVSENPSIGMKGDAAIRISTQSGVMTIVRQALFSEGNDDYVYAVDEGKLVKKSVTVGEMTDKRVEIRGGLRAGDEVALASNVSFTDGLRVKVR